MTRAKRTWAVVIGLAGLLFVFSFWLANQSSGLTIADVARLEGCQTPSDAIAALGMQPVEILDTGKNASLYIWEVDDGLVCAKWRDGQKVQSYIVAENKTKRFFRLLRKKIGI